MAKDKKIKVTLIKSPIGVIPKHKATVEALGLRKLQQSNVLPDNAGVRGMVNQVKHLVEVEELKGGSKK
ncbi:MAG: 50S ribosomal protein L30 [Lachnospiraceae bacterium]|jgi:large subunit ribosomal protein L30